MKRLKISEAEWEVLEVLWKKAPRTAAEVVAELAGTKAWAVNTIRTLLQRLARKGAIKASKATGVLSFMPALSRAVCVRQETRSFLERIFAGSAAPMLMHFVEESKLSPAELKELRRIIKQKEGR